MLTNSLPPCNPAFLWVHYSRHSIELGRRASVDAIGIASHLQSGFERKAVKHDNHNWPSHSYLQEMFTIGTSLFAKVDGGLDQAADEACADIPSTSGWWDTGNVVSLIFHVRGGWLEGKIPPAATRLSATSNTSDQDVQNIYGNAHKVSVNWKAQTQACNSFLPGCFVVTRSTQTPSVMSDTSQLESMP